MQPGRQAVRQSRHPLGSRHESCNGGPAMGQLIAVFAEGVERIGVPLLGLVLWSVRPALFTLVVLAGFAAGFRLALAVH